MPRVGSATVQGELWGARAEDWAAHAEPVGAGAWPEVLGRVGVGPGTRLLDVGCGAGAALVVARAIGAEVAGLDASTALVRIARDRLPGARVEVGEMEALPFGDGAFDRVVSFNSFQFAADLAQALREAARTCRHGGTVTWLVWGPRERCDTLLAGSAVVGLLPPAPAGSPPWAEAGRMEAAFRSVGLAPAMDGEVACAAVFKDREAAWRAMASSALGVRAVWLVGEERVRDAVLDAIEPFARSDGAVEQHNVFRWVAAAVR